MASTLTAATRRSASRRCRSAPPITSQSPRARARAAADIFRHDLIQKIRHLGENVADRGRGRPSAAGTGPSRLARDPYHADPGAGGAVQLARRPFSNHTPRALLIGSSTGGPQALMTLGPTSAR